MYNIIPFIIILVCLAVILSIVIKKLPLLAAFDINSIPEEKESQTRKKIMEERLERKAKVFYGKIKPFVKLVANFLQRKYKSLQEGIVKLEEKYKSKAQKEILVTKEEFQNSEKKMENLLAEGGDLAKKENFEEAEKKYLDILNLDPKNIAAYRGLGEIYFSQRQYEEAIQTFMHILKISKDDVPAFFQLAEIYYKLENFDKALVYSNKALSNSPKNPKYLDLLLNICIVTKNKDLAITTLAKFKEVNPENAKIAEFENKIKEL